MKYKFILFFCFFSVLLSTNIYASVDNITTEQVRIIKEKADQGDAEEQFNLGTMYYEGIEVKQDYSEAFKYFKLAADQGNDYAQFNLALMYEDGKGVKQSFSKAKELYKKSCDNGYQKGCDYYKDLNLKDSN